MEHNMLHNGNSAYKICMQVYAVSYERIRHMPTIEVNDNVNIYYIICFSIYRLYACNHTPLSYLSISTLN